MARISTADLPTLGDRLVTVYGVWTWQTGIPDADKAWQRLGFWAYDPPSSAMMIPAVDDGDAQT